MPTTSDPEQGKGDFSDDEREGRDTVPDIDIDIELEPDERVKAPGPDEDDEEIIEEEIDLDVDLDDPPYSEGPDA